MKKSVFLIVLAGLMMLAACNKDKESQGEAVFTASTEHQGGRTSLDPNNGQINWTAGDQIVIGNDNNETAIFNLQSGEGTSEGGFGTSGEFSTVGPFIAAYPSDAVIADDKVTFNLPAMQTIGETGTFGNGANPMVACSDDKNLQFKNLCGGLGIRLKGVGAHVSAVRITSKNTAEKLWGTYEVSNCAANEPTLAVAANNQGTNVITLNCDVTLTTAAKTFFVMLPPGTLANGFTMEVLDGDEVLSTKETTSAVALVERNSVKCFNEILIDVEFDGNVQIPTGMSNSDIIVTNFGEDAIPDENGDFAIGYSKLLMAKNADNGKLVYFTANSVDANILKDGGTTNDYELNAKETALFLTLRCLPFGLSNGPDANFMALKEVLYSLQCVKNLEVSVQNVVNTYGYLKIDELSGAVNLVKVFIYSELGFVGEEEGRNLENTDQIFLAEDQKDLQSPYLPTERAFGTYLSIKDATHSDNPEKWTVNCTGRNGLPTTFGVIKGEVVGMTKENNSNRGIYLNYQYDENDNMYYLAPAGLSKLLDIATLGDWEGVKEFFQEIRQKMQNWNSPFHVDFFKTKTENMMFEMPEPTLGNSNALCIVAPMDNTSVYIVNSIFAIMDLVDFAIPSYMVDPLIKGFLNDSEYVTMFQAQIHNGAQGREIILQETATKFFTLAYDCLIQAGIRSIPELLLALTGINTIVNSFDIVAEVTTSLYVKSFALSVLAEYTEPPMTMPDVVTGTCTVEGTTATITGTVNSIGSLSIYERGICYSTSPNPFPWSGICVPAEGTGVGTFECVIENLSPNTYYARAYAQTWVDPLGGYGDVISFTIGNGGGGGGDAPTGAINGLFTINTNGDQVYFSKGNLQYIGSGAMPFWKFADNQWDCLGHMSYYQTCDGDQFSWGTSGYNHGAMCYQPWESGSSSWDFWAYGVGTCNLYDQTGQADWGYNAIANGGNTENSGWRTLTKDEWNYVVNTRSVTSGIRFVLATVNNITGMILLPDNWSIDNYSLNNTNLSFSSNEITESQWAILEQHGAVFLPSANCGYYWTSSSTTNSSLASLLVITEYEPGVVGGGEKWLDCYVRLAHDAE